MAIAPFIQNGGNLAETYATYCVALLLILQICRVLLRVFSPLFKLRLLQPVPTSTLVLSSRLVPWGALLEWLPPLSRAA